MWGITDVSMWTFSFLVPVYIDGLEWQGVKFFQLSSQWQTHIKVLPVATMAAQQQQHTAL